MNGKERQHKESPIPRFIYHLQLLHSISLFFYYNKEASKLQEKSSGKIKQK